MGESQNVMRGRSESYRRESKCYKRKSKMLYHVSTMDASEDSVSFLEGRLALWANFLDNTRVIGACVKGYEHST